MSKYKLGLVNISTGAIASDGDMGTSLTPIGDTVAGTAVMTTSNDTTTDFNIEESSSPVMSIVSTPGAVTLTWSTYNNDVDNLVRLFGGTKISGNSNGIATTNTLVPGSGYVAGTYNNVPLAGGTGSGAKATIVVAVGGAVSSATITTPGAGYTAGDTLSAANINLGGSGSGFTVNVATVGSTGDRWDAPDTFQELEQSLMVQWKSGGSILIPRAKISGKLNFSFKKDTLSQLDITATILQPTKAGTSRLSIISDLP